MKQPTKFFCRPACRIIGRSRSEPVRLMSLVGQERSLARDSFRVGWYLIARQPNRQMLHNVSFEWQTSLPNHRCN
jgi:hypothetical protein